MSWLKKSTEKYDGPPRLPPLLGRYVQRPPVSLYEVVHVTTDDDEVVGYLDKGFRIAEVTRYAPTTMRDDFGFEYGLGAKVIMVCEPDPAAAQGSAASAA